MPPRSWRARMLRRFGLDTNASVGYGSMSIPHWLTGKSILFFFVSLFACWWAFGYVPAWDLVIVSCISVVLFFYGGSAMAKSWSRISEKHFIKNIVLVGFLIRLLWVLYCYFIFNPEHYGTPIGDKADVEWYMPLGKAIAEWLTAGSNMSFGELTDRWHAAMDDWGYPIWLGVEYAVWGSWSDVFMPMLIKCIVSAYSTVFIYHVANRHFGEGTARMAAFFVALNPNMIYWCGNMFKESEMVFLCCLAIDNFDKVLMSGQRYTFKNLLPGVLAGLSLMFFRAALGIVFFLAVFAHIVTVSHRVMSTGKKILAGVLVAVVLLVSMGERLRSQSQALFSAAQSDAQKEDMQWRAEQKGGNSFATYAGAAVFAPLIFTIPFPTFNQANEAQLLQVQLSGGSYIKNILSFFVIMLMFILLISGEWRRHVFILAYTLGYLMVLVLSNFAQSGRFHMPIWPMLMLFSAYGIQVTKNNARWRRLYTLVLVLEVVVCLAWSWFKLAGRGMI